APGVVKKGKGKKREKSKEKILAKAAKKAAKKAARQAERRARAENNNRAARNALVAREAKRARPVVDQVASNASNRESRKRALESSPKSTASVPSKIQPAATSTLNAYLMVSGVIAVLATLGWFFWPR
ncbi:MAG TPA: hypothetical protein VJT73_14630, partial [Polyangiaceae bacterium]|nr:hypothetical protein [Polyangiaceae bacterium]